MKAKSISIFFILLFFYSQPVINGSYSHLNDNIITVDDEGDGDYTSIKTALANANPGDTIEVYSGTYYEHNIEIYLINLTLSGKPYEMGIGNDTGRPIIDGEGKYGDIISISMTSGVTVENLILKNRLDNDICSIFDIYDCSNLTISNNTAMNASMTLIPVTRCEKVRIINNTAKNSVSRQGIRLYHSYNCEVIGNYVENAGIEGIMVWVGDENYIANNQVYNSGYGICIIGKRNIIENNHIENNDYGMSVFNTNNVIIKNNFVDNVKGDAYFEFDVDIFPFHNNWEHNYWNRPRILPCPVIGTIFLFIPWVQFDWRPALVLNEI